MDQIKVKNLPVTIILPVGNKFLETAYIVSPKDNDKQELSKSLLEQVSHYERRVDQYYMDFIIEENLKISV